MLLSTRSMLKRVSLKPQPRPGGRLASLLDADQAPAKAVSGTAVSPALDLAGEQLSARPSEFVATRRQANGE
jgi:hypothetical protein